MSQPLSIYVCLFLSYAFFLSIDFCLFLSFFASFCLFANPLPCLADRRWHLRLEPATSWMQGELKIRYATT